MSTYGSHPEQMTVKLTLGDGAHLVATSTNGWAGPVSLVWGPDDGQWTEETSTLTDVGTVDGAEVSWTLTAEQVTARAGFPYVRLVDNGMTLKAGEVIPWRGGLGATVTQTIASLTAGPPGPTAVSADADNVAGLGSDGLIYVPESVGGGGDTTVQIGTVTLPESPTVGLSVSVLADSATILPEGVTWDSGGEPTITERMLLVFVWSGTDWVGTYGPSIPDAPVPPDETGPTAGTLGVVVGVTSADGTVTGAEDETELDAAPYSFRIDAGSWSAWQAGNTYEWTGLTAETEYDFQHRVRDAAGNITEGAVVTDTTDADTTAPTAGTLGVVPGVTTADLTVSGASDETALHATPYAYSTDNGSTWSAYQAGATYEATGLTADTSYTFRHKVRDAAGNETVGTAVTDSTNPVPSDTTPPTPGTLAGSAITSSGFTLTVTGASDETALHAQPYRFSTDNGVTYSAYQTAATFDATGLDPATEYTCVHQVRDAALNVATGSSIAVTTSAAGGSFSPADLTGLYAWYDASDTATITSDANGVSAWADKSSNGFNLAQSIVGERPATGEATINGLNVLTFDGSSRIRHATASDWKVLHDGTAYIIAAVAQFDAGARRTLFATGEGLTSGVGTWFYWNTTNPNHNFQHVAANGTAATLVAATANSALAAATPGALTILADPDNATAATRSKIAVNAGAVQGSNTATAAPSAGNPESGLIIGSLSTPSVGTGHSGHVAEFVVVTGSDATEANRAALAAYLMDKWGIA